MGVRLTLPALAAVCGLLPRRPPSSAEDVARCAALRCTLGWVADVLHALRHNLASVKLALFLLRQVRSARVEQVLEQPD